MSVERGSTGINGYLNAGFVLIILVLLGFGGIIYWIFHTQWGAKYVGGTYEMKVPENEKLKMITWKGSNLWVLTRPMEKDEKAETYKLYEESTIGILSGTVIIKEEKK